MKYIEKANITRYEDGDFIIEIEERDDMYEAWLRHREYGIEYSMFDVNKTDVSGIEEFTQMVEDNLPLYEKDYIEEV